MFRGKCPCVFFGYFHKAKPARGLRFTDRISELGNGTPLHPGIVGKQGARFVEIHASLLQRFRIHDNCLVPSLVNACVFVAGSDSQAGGDGCRRPTQGIPDANRYPNGITVENIAKLVRQRRWVAN
jgi:hypothetical protein